MNTDVNITEKKRNQKYGLVILSIIVVPMIVAYIMFNTGWGIPSGTTNKGILLEPAQSIQDLPLLNQDATLKALYASDEKKWRILVPVTKNCARNCAQHLYLTRQVHIRLAEKAYRVQRILLVLDELSVSELDNLNKEHPETLVLSSDKASLSQWLAESQLPDTADNYYYLVDQEGFAMMRYDMSHTGQHLLDDIKKLLKFTYDK